MIRTGLVLHASTSERFALAGPIIKDWVGNVLVLVPRAILSLGDTVRIRVGDELVSAGKRPGAYYPAESEVSSVAQLVAWFSPSVVIEIDERALWSTAASASSTVLPTNIVIPALQSETCGYICAADYFASFRLPDHEKSFVIEGLLKGTTDGNAGMLGIPGIAGAAVTTESNELLGLVVGILDGDVLIAPIDQVLADEGLELASAKDIEQHNHRIERQAKETIPKALAQILASLAFDKESSWQAAVAGWIVTGWLKHFAGDHDAFAPHQSFFEPIGRSRVELEQRLWEFGWTLLSAGDFDQAHWDGILRNAYFTIDMIGEPTDQATKPAGPSSYDIVIGRSRAA